MAASTLTLINVLSLAVLPLSALALRPTHHLIRSSLPRVRLDLSELQSATKRGRGRGRGGGRGGGAARRIHARSARGSPDDLAARRARKATRTRHAEEQVDAKLAADASFFWECVQKLEEGIDITGCSGKPPEPRDAAALFGDGDGGGPAGLHFAKYDKVPVSRAGAGASEAEVPQLDVGFELGRGPVSYTHLTLPTILLV